MAIQDTIYTPRTLGKVIRRMPPVHTFFRSTFFRNVRTFPTKSVDVDFKKGSRALAPFVHPRAGGKTVIFLDVRQGAHNKNRFIYFF